jgi:hypothetical protein
VCDVMLLFYELNLMIIHCSADYTKFHMSVQIFMRIVTALNNILLKL